MPSCIVEVGGSKRGEQDLDCKSQDRAKGNAEGKGKAMTGMVHDSPAAGTVLGKLRGTREEFMTATRVLSMTLAQRNKNRHP